ncbi:MAG: oligosaccharide flippase family protein [Bacteroidaceae bacterium]|nr:oligosaccharide flippase family protein [Bacteroidaceae bacterium]
MKKALPLPDFVGTYMQKKEQKEQTESYEHVIKYTGLFGGVQGINLLASVLRSKLVAVLLGSSGMGLISMYNTAATFLGNATSFGISFSAVRNIAELCEAGDRKALEDFICVVRTWSVATALLGFLVCILCSPLLSLSYYDTTAHWTSFLFLAPLVGLIGLYGGEMAILKGGRQLRQVAVQSIINSLFTLLISIPLYYIWGESAIWASLLLVAVANLLTILYFSCRFCPFRFSLFSRHCYVKGWEMVRLGIAFLIAGILGSGVEFLVRAFMVRIGSEADVGFYNAGDVLVYTYGSMVFLAMETEYYPRLSAVIHNIKRSNEVVNRQIEASVLLVAPLLVLFLVLLPVLLPLLYTDSFMPVVGMAQCAVFSMYMRAIALPISYMVLVKGRSGIYLLAEGLYNLLALVLIVLGYQFYGLWGTGVALSLASTFDFLIVFTICAHYYKFRLHKLVWVVLGVQLPFGIATFAVTQFSNGLLYWILGALCFLGSMVVSVYILYKKTEVLQKLWLKIKPRIFWREK